MQNKCQKENPTTKKKQPQRFYKEINKQNTKNEVYVCHKVRKTFKKYYVLKRNEKMARVKVKSKSVENSLLFNVSTGTLIFAQNKQDPQWTVERLVLCDDPMYELRDHHVPPKLL